VRETGASEVFFSQAGEQKNGGKKEWQQIFVHRFDLGLELFGLRPLRAVRGLPDRPTGFSSE
jgi:hypothetical protein